MVPNNLFNHLVGFEEIWPSKRMEVLLQNGDMKGIPLGTCLESWRWGSETDVMWETNIKGMVSFIENWINQNQGNYSELFNEERYNYYKISRLPHIDHKACPRNDKHKEIVTDLSGKVRCAHVDRKKLRPSFIDNYPGHIDGLSQVKTISYFEDMPKLEIPDEEDWEGSPESYMENFKDDIERYEREIQRFDDEEQTELIETPCYSILSDKDLVLSLETILRRLNLVNEVVKVTCDMERYHNECSPERIENMSKEERKDYDIWPVCHGHPKPVCQVVYSFDGISMALYVKMWNEQSSNPPLFETESQARLNQAQLFNVFWEKYKLRF